MGRREIGWTAALAALVACSSGGLDVIGDAMVDAGKALGGDAAQAQPRALEGPCVPNVISRSWESGYTVEHVTEWYADIPVDGSVVRAMGCEPTDYAAPACPGRATCAGAELAPLDCGSARWQRGDGFVRVLCGSTHETNVGEEEPIRTGWHWATARVYVD